MYLAEILYRGDLHDTIVFHEKNPSNFEVIQQQIELNYPGEEDHVRITLINQETNEREDITLGEIKCSQK